MPDPTPPIRFSSSRDFQRVGNNYWLPPEPGEWHARQMEVVRAEQSRLESLCVTLGFDVAAIKASACRISEGEDSAAQIKVPQIES